MYYKCTYFVLLCAVICVQGLRDRSKTNDHEPQSRIQGGMRSDIMQYPYTAFLSIQGAKSKQCGGAIISNTSVITAASCLVGAQMVNVRIGSNYRTSGGQQYMSTTFNLYSRYNENTTRFNVAIVQIPEGMQLDGEKTASIPVANDAGPQAGTFVTVTGYGARSKGEAGSVALYMAKMRVLQDSQCSANPLFDDSKFCTSGDKMDICEGDEGDPAVQDSKLYGVASSPQCGSSNTPSLYTQTGDARVRFFIASRAGV